MYPEYKKNSQSSVVKNQPNSYISKNLNRYFTKEKRRMPNKPLKNAQHCCPLGNCTLKSW